MATGFGSLWQTLGASADNISRTQNDRIRRLIAAGEFNIPFEKVLLARERRLGRIRSLKFGKDHNIIPEKKSAPKLLTMWDLVELISELMHTFVTAGSITGPAAEWLKILDICLKSAHSSPASQVLEFFSANCFAASQERRSLSQYTSSLFNSAFIGGGRPAFAFRTNRGDWTGERETNMSAPAQRSNEICRNFNRGRCRNSNCLRKHACDICGKRHPAISCWSGNRGTARPDHRDVGGGGGVGRQTRDSRARQYTTRGQTRDEGYGLPPHS